jgi:hypothetical protein
MSPKRWLGTGLFVILLLEVPRIHAAPDGQQALSQVPAGSPVVAQIHGVMRAKNRLVDMVKNALPDVAPKLEAKLNDALINGIDGRKLQGIKPDDYIFVVLTALPDLGQQAPPAIAILVPVSDYKAFRDGLLKDDERRALKADPAGYDMTARQDGMETFFVQRNGYAVVTPSKEVAQQFTKQSPGLTLDKTVADTLLNADAGMYLDVAALNAKYGQRIQGLRQFIGMAFQKDQPGLGNAGPFLNAILDGVFQAVADAKTYVKGAEFLKEGLAVHTQAQVGPNTKTDQFLSKFPSSEFSQLNALQAGQLGYYEMRLTPDVIRACAPLTATFFGTTPQAHAVEKSLRELADANPHWVAGDFGVPARGLQTWSFDHPNKAAAAQLEEYRTLQSGDSYQFAMLKDKPEIKPNAKQHRGYQLNYVHFTWDLDKMLQKAGNGPDAAQAAAVMKRLLGEGMEIWFGTDGKGYVVVCGPNWDDVQKQLDQYLDHPNTVGAVTSYEDTRKHLPQQATLALMMDLPRYAVVVGSTLLSGFLSQRNPQAAANIPKAENMKPCYLGVVVRLEAQNARMDAWVPGAAVQEIYQAYKPVFEGGNRQ